MVPVELHHGLEREIADHVTVEDEERVCSLGEQVAGQSQGPGWGRGEDSIFLGLNPWIQAQEASPRPSLPSSLTLNPLPKNFLPLLTCPQRFLFMGHGDSDSKPLLLRLHFLLQHLRHVAHGQNHVVHASLSDRTAPAARTGSAGRQGRPDPQPPAAPHPAGPYQGPGPGPYRGQRFHLVQQDGLIAEVHQGLRDA